jgi:glyoxylase-like metal-dependent hydrolase (beta-lactamase superfamily II)
MRRLVVPVLPDTILNEGDVVSSGNLNLNVMWTPGHSPGHICLYEPEQKILFAGDHLLPINTPNVSLSPQSTPNPLNDFLVSLNRLAQLDIRLVLPAHEHPFNDHRTRVSELVQHHDRRNAEILEAIKADPKTAYQIAHEVTWMVEEGGVSFTDLAPWDKRMAVMEALAHIEAMRVDSRLSKLQRDGITYYQRS